MSRRDIAPSLNRSTRGDAWSDGRRARVLIRRPRGRRTHWGSAGERDGKRFAAADGRRGTSVRTTKPWLSQPKGAESRRSGPHRGASRGSSSLASGGERRKESSRSQGPNVRTTTAVKNRGPQARGKAPRSAARARRAHRMTRMSGAAASGGRWVQAAEMPERERGHATRCTKWTPREGRFQRRRPFRVCALHLGARCLQGRMVRDAQTRLRRLPRRARVTAHADKPFLSAPRR